jgi:hypothetical protein
VSPVKYELGFNIARDDILHSHRRGSLKSYNGTEVVTSSGLLVVYPPKVPDPCI